MDEETGRQIAAAESFRDAMLDHMDCEHIDPDEAIAEVMGALDALGYTIVKKPAEEAS